MKMKRLLAVVLVLAFCGTTSAQQYKVRKVAVTPITGGVRVEWQVVDSAGTVLWSGANEMPNDNKIINHWLDSLLKNYAIEQVGSADYQPPAPTATMPATHGQSAHDSTVQPALGFTPEDTANKNATNGYAGLTSGKLAASQLPNPSASALGGVRSLTCSGTDKLSAIGTDGIPVCSADQTSGGGGVAFREFLLCTAGNVSAGVCNSWTNLGAAFSEIVNSGSRAHIDFTGFTQFRVMTVQNAAAVSGGTGDLIIQCDSDPAYGSPVTLGQLDNVITVNGMILGAWTNIPAGECQTAGGVYVRAGMSGGNTTEDPSIRFVRLQVK
jgi:hypothetical protein